MIRTFFRFSVPFVFLLVSTGCDQQLLRPFNPTGNPETPAAPQPVPAPQRPPALYPDNSIDFLHEYVRPGESVLFRVKGFDPNEKIHVTIARPDGTEVEHPASADGYGVLEGSVSVPADRPPGLHTVTITGQSSGYFLTGQFSVASVIEAEDDLEFPVCQETALMLGEIPEIDDYVGEIRGCRVPASLATCSYVPGTGNAGTLTIKCEKAGTGRASIDFVRAGTNQVETVEFWFDCVGSCE